MAGDQRVIAEFARLGITYVLVEHAAVFTVAESRRLDQEMPGAHTKNLFLKDGTGRFWLATVPAEIRVDLKRLPAAIGSKRLSFGNPQELHALLGVEPGAVTPLAALNDVQRRVTVVLDARLATAEQVNVHPLRNTATVRLAASDLLTLLAAWDHPPVIVEVPTLAAAALR